MSEELRSLAELDRILHEPARLVIATILFGVEKADFLYLLNATGLTKGNLSAHLAKLEAAGYLNVEKTYRGKIPQTLLRLTPEGRTAFENYRNQLNKLVKHIS